MSTRQGIFPRSPVASRVYLEQSRLTALAPSIARGVELEVWGNKSPVCRPAAKLSGDFSKHSVYLDQMCLACFALPGREGVAHAFRAQPIAAAFQSLTR
jgi:hypothetical protein